MAFLLAQLGAHAADRFAEAMAGLDLTPALAGVMRLLTVEPGLSQQQLAERLGAAPSRVVGLVDDLERRGWIVRTRDATDRRVNVVTVTDAGRAAFRSIARAAVEHDKRLTGALDGAQRATLQKLLGQLAADQGLVAGVHPGYRRL